MTIYNVVWAAGAGFEATDNGNQYDTPVRPWLGTEDVEVSATMATTGPAPANATMAYCTAIGGNVKVAVNDAVTASTGLAQVAGCSRAIRVVPGETISVIAASE